MKRKNKNNSVIYLSDVVVTIIHGEKSMDISKERFKTKLLKSAKEQFDTSYLGKLKNVYLNAYEWLLANLYRVIGIQLYDDGEIRLNILPSEIVNDKKCMFLKEDELKNREMDDVLYVFLLELIYGKPQGNRAN